MTNGEDNIINGNITVDGDLIVHGSIREERRPDAESDFGKEEYRTILELSNARAIHYHESLWEEEKHYTWWISVLFGFLILVMITDVLDWSQKYSLILAISLMGIAMCRIGYVVIRKEGEYFSQERGISDRILKKLGLTDEHNILPFKIDDIADFDTVKNKSNKSLSVIINGIFSSDPNKHPGIRDFFQLTLVIYGVIFVVFIVVSVIQLFQLACNIF